MIFKIFLLISLVSSFLGMILIVKKNRNQIQSQNKKIEITKTKNSNFFKNIFSKTQQIKPFFIEEKNYLKKDFWKIVKKEKSQKDSHLK
jgi:cell division protein FtsL